jgi:hypothetical protein
MSDGGSIAERDKMIIDLQTQAIQKKKQLQKNYEELLIHIQENPYLQEAIDNYRTYFKGEEERIKRQIAALKNVLKIAKNKKDQKEIKGEIKALEKSLYSV